ncbi:hypothetical protein D9613_010262 [Agrocybe pediades]|uniref:FAS1 domain-containing protein n=1 Tax=Agrocybe pediades TaxID=84607 RepID=A0A8H4QFX4_9AGAR|nr:hypothetical protein D9613_010262 [Agrocybe pediades]
MRFTGLPLPLLLPLAAPLLAAAQDQNSNSSDSSSSSYSQECISALQSAGFTKLADTLTSINDTDQGRALWEQLSSGRNFTVFAPNDAAFQNVSSDISGNSTLLAEYLSYHFVQGDFTNSSYTNSSSSSGGGGAAGAGTSTVTESTTQSQSTSSGAAATSTATSTESSTQSTTETSTQTSTSTSTTSESTSTSTSTDTNTATSTATDTATSTAVVTTTAALFERLFGRQDQSGGNSSSSSNSSSSDNPQPYSGVYPNVTIGRTLLNASGLVNLEGNKSQVLVWTRSGQDGNVTIWNQADPNRQNITVTNGTRWNNLFINGITGVLIPPGNLTTALTAINATAAENLLTSVQVPGSQQGNPGIVGGGAGGGASTSTVTESTTQSQSGDSASQTSTITETSTQSYSKSSSSSSDSSSSAESTTTETATDTATDTGSVTAPATDNGWARTTGRWWQPRQTGGVFRRQDQSGGGDQDQGQGQGQGGAAEPGPGGAGNATGSGGVSALEALQQAKGITLFVPNNEAFTSEVNQTLQGLQDNGTESSNLIMNHYINGTSLYSTQMTNDTNATTAAGEPLTFSRNDTGLFVSSGNSTAQITRPDVLLNNGVAHVISGVLLVQGRDEEAASSAYQSATSQAAVPTTETAPIGAVGAGGMMSTVTAQPLQSSASSSAAASSSEMSSSSGSQSQSESESQSQSQTSSSAESTTTSTATSTQPPISSNGGGGGAQSTVTETAATTQSAFVIRGLKVRNSAGVSAMKGMGVWVLAMTSVVGGACLLVL